MGAPSFSPDFGERVGTRFQQKNTVAAEEAAFSAMFDSIHPRRRWSIWALAPLILALAAISVPYLLTRGHLLIAFALQHAFSLVCHQRPDRSFRLFGAPIAVCSRCLGIYLGAAIGLLLRTSRRTALQLFIAAATLNLLDGLTELTGLHGNWITVRFVLGLALGAAGGLMVCSSMQPAIVEARNDGHGNAIAAGLGIR